MDIKGSNIAGKINFRCVHCKSPGEIDMWEKVCFKTLSLIKNLKFEISSISIVPMILPLSAGKIIFVDDIDLTVGEKLLSG